MELVRRVDAQCHVFFSHCWAAGGLFVGAVRSGFKELRTEFLDIIHSLEKDFVADPLLPTTYALSALRKVLAMLSSNAHHDALLKYQVLFPRLVSLVDDINGKVIRGAQVLSTIYRHSEIGVPMVSQFFKRLGLCVALVCMVTVSRLAAHAQQVLFSFMMAWCVHGTLIDTEREFFIIDYQSDRGTSSSSVDASVLALYRGATPATSLLAQDDETQFADDVPPQHFVEDDVVQTARDFDVASARYEWERR